jgi:AcrR family transcriptional regulator
MTKTDRRVQRTREQLQKALIELIGERGYDAITIQEIVDRANLGRTTFYLHYNSKDDLFMSCHGPLLARAWGQLPPLQASGGHIGNPQIFGLRRGQIEPGAPSSNKVDKMRPILQLGKIDRYAVGGAAAHQIRLRSRGQLVAPIRLSEQIDRAERIQQGAQPMLVAPSDLADLFQTMPAAGYRVNNVFLGQAIRPSHIERMLDALLQRGMNAGECRFSGYSTRRRRSAAAVAAARLLTSSLAKICTRWVLTVRSLIVSATAISLFERPCATSRSTSRSRAVRPPAAVADRSDEARY